MWKVHEGDCRGVMGGMAESSVDAVVTDPPYDLLSVSRNGSGRSNEPENPYGRHGSHDGGFMGMKWDGTGIAFRVETWEAVLRVLKPGGHLVAFGGTRTSHRMVCAIEDAGFEIRDSLVWLYGSGFPKSLDVSKAFDKADGRDREDKFEGSFERHAGPTGNKRCVACGKWLVSGSPCQCPRPQDEPQSDLARVWDGWGTALKPGHEPIVLARKPLIGTVVANVERYGTGALNIDGCRIETTDKVHVPQSNPAARQGVVGQDLGFSHNSVDRIHEAQEESINKLNTQGRWPANVVLDEEAAALLDQQSGQLTSGQMRPGHMDHGKQERVFGVFSGRAVNQYYGGDTGGASRFFYTAKASRSERNEGLDDLPEKPLLWSSGTQNPGSFQSEGTHKAAQNNHPTVKPVALMSWLIRLVTPPGGIVLDPFTGSGSTGVAAVKGGWDFIGIEKEPEYVVLARRRIGAVTTQLVLPLDGA